MNAALVDALAALEPAHFAVMDGAHFDNLPAVLEASSLRAIALYLEAVDGEGLAAGPYLVPLTSQALAQTVSTIVGNLPAVVFWSWPGTPESLRRHLRGINLAEIPVEGSAEYETVLFRHWDANVLAVTVPVLTAEQPSRLLGPANGLAYDASEHGGVVKALRPDALPPAPGGLLRFEPGQMAAMTQRRLAASHRRIAAYLREVAPEHVARMDGPALQSAITRFEGEARALGLSVESDIARWSYLQIIAGGDLFTDDDVKGVFAAQDTTLGPTQRLDRLMQAVQQGLEAGG